MLTCSKKANGFYQIIFLHVITSSSILALFTYVASISFFTSLVCRRRPSHGTRKFCPFQTILVFITLEGTHKPFVLRFLTHFFIPCENCRLVRISNSSSELSNWTVILIIRSWITVSSESTSFQGTKSFPVIRSHPFLH